MLQALLNHQSQDEQLEEQSYVGSCIADYNQSDMDDEPMEDSSFVS